MDRVTDNRGRLASAAVRRVCGGSNVLKRKKRGETDKELHETISPHLLTRQNMMREETG